MAQTEKVLIVASGPRVIGTVSEASDIFTFKYDDGWLGLPESFDLSPQLKRTTQTHTGTGVRNFLENLLPEEGNRQKIAEMNKVDVKDIVGLLEITGRDSAGALQIYTEEEFKHFTYDPGKVTTLSLAELTEGIKKNGTGINYITSIGLKPSLSGAQDKIACRYEEARGEIAFPLAGGATTFILKPNKATDDKKYKSLEKAALNELICLRLAKKILKNVPATSFYESANRDLFIIERYDRVKEGAEIKRIHQFDFCQYFGISSADKYEVSMSGAKKGPHGVKEIYEAIQTETEEATDTEKLFDWVVFNYLIHNTDSHLKNISMIATDTGFKLAPFYDITSVGFYKYGDLYLFDNRFAFEIGGMSKMDEICDIQWRKFAEHLEIGPDYFLLKIRQMAYDTLKALTEVHTELKQELKEPRNLTDMEKILRYLGTSVEEKVNRCLTNTAFKTKETNCVSCGKKLPKGGVLNIGPECMRRFD